MNKCVAIYANNLWFKVYVCMGRGYARSYHKLYSHAFNYAKHWSEKYGVEIYIDKSALQLMLETEDC